MSDTGLDIALDTLHARALRGDKRAEAELFSALRVRFLALSKRRVRPDHQEDVVQETLGVVLEKYRDLAPGRGILVWSLAVLRNVIGNHYQRTRRHRDRTVEVEDWQALPAASSDPDPLATLNNSEAAARLETAIAELARRTPRCGAIFAGLLESMERGGGPREVSMRALELVQKEFPDLNRNAFYVALHRCRAQLRALLDLPEGSHG